MIRAFLRVTAVLFFGVALTPRAGATISYRISLAHPEQHLFHVTMQVPVDGRDLSIAMPAWNALYQIRDFAERVRDVSAACSSAMPVPLAVRKVDKQDWQVAASSACAVDSPNAIVINYSVLWDSPGPFDSQLNAHHAFLNFAEILFYIPNRRAEGVALEITELPAGWRTATALAAVHVDNSYIAPSYDALADAPMEAGKFDKVSFTSEGAQIRAVIDAKEWNRAVLEDDLRRITGSELKMMGEAPFDPPYRSYTFLIHIGPVGEVGGGGMEHRNSAAIAAPSIDDAVVIAAHEFFHAWNVKRIRPQSLEPVDYSREQYTRALWFAEGVTSTYGAYTLERTGLWSKEQFYDDLASQIEALRSRPARLWQSAEESSLDAWFEGFPEYAEPARSISYYNKGQILGVMLDLAIRDATDNRKSLDDVLRLMNDKYAHQGKFYADSEGIRSAIEEISGKDFQDFFARYISGTDEIPYNKFLSIVGLTLESRSSTTHDASRFSIAELPHPSARQIRIRQSLLSGD